MLMWLLVTITMMIRMTMTSRTGTEADSGDWSPVVFKCHQRLIILYVVYHGSTISQADCNHLLLRRLTTTTTAIQLLQNNNNDTTTTKQECGLGLDVLVWRPIKASAYVSSRMDWQMPWSRTWGSWSQTVSPSAHAWYTLTSHSSHLTSVSHRACSTHIFYTRGYIWQLLI